MKRANRVFYILLLCALVLAALCGCAETPPEKTTTPANTVYTTRAFSGPVSALLPEYNITEQHGSRPDFLHTGLAVEAYDFQAENITGKYWYPLTLETVVIAVDRSRTEAEISSWYDLQDRDRQDKGDGSLCPESMDNGEGNAVGVPGGAPFSRMAVAAICFAEEGGDFTLGPAVRLFRALHEEGRLGPGDENAPIRICFDSEAAARIGRGENVEIIIPEQGTLSFTKGLLSNRPLALPADTEKVLADSGLRTIGGLCDEALYPAKSAYAPAVTLENYGRMGSVTQDWTRTLRRDVLRARLYTTADVREHNVFAGVFIIVSVIWIAGMMRRSRQKDIRQVILAMGILIIGWVATRYVKYELIDFDGLAGYLWYVYYIFEVLLPLCVVRIASLIGAAEEKRRAPPWFKALCALNVALAALVMTNDFHSLAFKLDMGPSGWTGDYSYGVLYYIIMAVLVCELILGIALIFARIKHSPRRFGVVFPLLFITALVVYCVGYSLRIPVFYESDMTLVICILAMLFIEVCLRAGQIPVNTRYRELFKNAGLKLQITDDCGGSIFASNGAEPVEAGQWELLKDSEDSVQAGENTLLLKNRISGGYAVWQEDISFINKLREEIAASNNEIEAANALLAGEARSKEQRARNLVRKEFYDLYESEIEEHERRLAGLLETENLKEAALLSCYIKRKSYFLYIGLEGRETLSVNELVVYIDEMAELARLAGIGCLTYSGLTGDVGRSEAMLFYDFWAALLEWAVSCGMDEIILNTLSENHRLVMRAVAPFGARDFELPEKTARDIGAAGGAFEKTEDKDIGFTVLRLSLPERGGRDA